MTSKKPAYIAIDVETTGLSAENDHLLEVAVLLVAEDLSVIDMCHSLIVPQSARESRSVDVLMEHCNEIVHQMHHDNALWSELERDMDSLPSAARFDTELHDMLTDNEVTGRLPLLGSSVDGIDRAMFEKNLPVTYSEFVSYRSVNVSSLLELAERTFGMDSAQREQMVERVNTRADVVTEGFGVPNVKHRALADIVFSLVSIDELLDFIGAARAL